MSIVNRTYIYTKRLVDLSLSLIGLIFLSPLMLVVSLLILVTTRGPVFFVQTRPGKDEEDFEII